jgi:hypothetical protein
MKSKRFVIIAIGSLILFAGATIFILSITSKPNIDTQGISASTFSVVMPQGLTEPEVKELTNIIMQDDVLRDIQSGLPEPSRSQIPDVATIRGHLVLRIRKHNQRIIVDIVWKYEKPRFGRFAMPEVDLQKSIADKIDELIKDIKYEEGK